MAWIDCTKELPKDREVVLCAIPGYREVAVCRNNGILVEFYMHNGFQLRGVTHFQRIEPLPTPPNA